jgi:hypothetical protein
MNWTSMAPIVGTAVQFLWGLIVKYHPKLGNLPNASIPWVNFVLGLLQQMVTPQAAHAAGLHEAHLLPGVVLSFWGGVGGVFAPVLQAGWQAITTSLIYEVFGKGVVEKGLGWQPNAAAAK